jgi:hypothetical protein
VTATARHSATASVLAVRVKDASGTVIGTGGFALE